MYARYRRPGLSSKEGQCLPVAPKTSSEGRFLLLIPNTRQERGKAGSQVILKYWHFRQLGAVVDTSSPLRGKIYARRACLSTGPEFRNVKP